MSDAVSSMADAMRLLAATRPGADPLVQGTATAGHHCHACGGDTVEVAPVLRLTADGPVLFVWLYHCTNPNCGPVPFGTPAEES